MTQPAPVLPGAEPFSSSGGPAAVLVLHGFTGSPQSMRGLAHAFAAAGFSVELPLLPGHGTAVEDMVPTRWEDWSGAAELAYQELAGRSDQVLVAGLSMGGTLSCWLAAHHPEIAGLVLVNPAVEPPAPSFLDMFRGTLEAGMETIPAIGNDVADPESTELAYDATPVAAVLSLFGAVTELEPKLGEIRCPVLLFNSPQDHVVPPSAGDLLASRVAGPVERVTLERSYHVATIDYDKDEIETRAVEFAAQDDGLMAERLTRDTVAHVAKLARLGVTEDELEQFTDQLGAVLEHAADIEKLDTEGVPPTAHPLPLENVLRDDVVVAGVDRDEVLAAAPSVEDGRFRVPRILGEAP